MAAFLETNVYSFRGTVLIYGACLPEVSPEGFGQLCAQSDMAFSLCLERDHLNMAITKLTAILGTGQVKQLLFASVDRSPHCVQLHYIQHEIERIMPEHAPMKSFVVVGNQLINISSETVELSKSLARLEKEKSWPSA